MTRKLSKLTHNNQFDNIIYYDVETTKVDYDYKSKQEKSVGEHILKIGYASRYKLINKKYYALKDDSFFKTNKEFLDFFLSFNKTKDVYIFAHNQSFDYRISGNVIFRYLIKNKYKVGFVNFNPFIIVLKKKISEKHNRKVIFLDSMNYYRNASIEKLGKMINLKKGIIDFDTCSMKELKLYCKRDVDILSKSMNELLLYCIDIKKGFTIGSMALNMYRSKFLEHDIYLNDYNPSLDIESNSYYGGRVECFYIGEIPNKVYKLDINSLYPFVALNKLPTKCVYHFQSKNDISKKYYDIMKNKEYISIITALVETKKPCLPLRSNGKLLFPIGIFKTTICQPEIDLLLKMGGKIHKIYSFSVYECDYIFRKYMKYFYNERLTVINEIQNKLFKAFLNHLYGKFGEQNVSIDHLPAYDNLNQDGEITYFEEDNKNVENVCFFSGLAFIKGSVKKLTNHSFVAISSFITSFGRKYLYEIINTCNQKGVAFYCDTDSIFTNGRGYLQLKHLIDKKEFGKLKLEDEGYCNLHNLKDYEFNNERIMKGVSKKAKRLSENKYEYTRFSGLNESMNKFNEKVIELKVIKIRKPIYSKGILSPNNYVTPFVFQQKG